MNIYLYKNYNNYYNRIVKSHDTLDGYEDWYSCSQGNINFSPNDYMTTKQLINHNNASQCDYAIITDENDNIDSRWFVIESQRKRHSQWELTLRRDILADYWNEIKQSKAYIYKGQVNYGSPLIWNSEGISLNQIKKSEHLLELDDHPWVVGYVAENFKPEDENEIPLDIYSIKADYEGWGPLTGIVDVSSPVKNYSVVRNNDILVNIIKSSESVKYQLYPWKPFTGEVGIYDVDKAGRVPTVSGSVHDWLVPTETLRRQMTTWLSSEFTLVDDSFPTKRFYCHVGNKYYRVDFDDTTDITDSGITRYGEEIARSFFPQRAYYDGGSYSIDYKYSNFHITESPEPAGTIVNWKLKADNSLPNTGAPYKIFCFPYSNYTYKNARISREEVIPTITAIGRALGSKLYDIQIVPYPPCTTWEFTTDIVDGSNNIKMGLFWATSTTTSGELTVPNELKYTLNDNSKVDNDTLMYRIVSPNYNGTFEFNPVKNGGFNKLFYDQTLKPYSPHIHVYPSFSGLYGNNFDDARGLICAGDFSLPRSTDQFAEYELNNKNYQLQFDRQIESMELKKKWGTAEGIVNIVGGTTAGGVMGGKLAGAPGAVAGSLVGGLEAGLNLAENLSLQNDAIQAAKQQFDWNLQNIQARPYNLTNVGVLNNDYKYFPFIEVYDCTDEEKEILRNKIEFEGMTINAIGKISDYYTDGGYIQCTPIRLENIPEDFNLLNEIGNELMKGVYVQNGI